MWTIQPTCLICSHTLPNIPSLPAICPSCADSIPYIHPADILCPRCGRAIACPDCRRSEVQARAYRENRSAVRYTPAMRTWLRTYKFLGEQRLAPTFAHMLLPVARELIFRHRMHYPVLTFVPISASRGRERGFNQAQFIATELARHLRLPVLSLLTRPDESAQHSMHNRQSRILTSAHFQLPTPLPDLPAPCDALLIVDDVYTTGGTLAACASTLEIAYDAPIFCLTWARS